MFDGHCHFCGDEIELNKRGWTARMSGHWEADHVVQKKNGGSDNLNNLLPACTRCNRLRWGRSGRSLRRVIVLGLVAKEAAFNFHESKIGPQVRADRIEQLGENWYRRMRNELKTKSLTDEKLKSEVALLKKRRVSLTKALSRFEGESTRAAPCSSRTEMGRRFGEAEGQVSEGRDAPSVAQCGKSARGVRIR